MFKLFFDGKKAQILFSQLHFYYSTNSFHYKWLYVQMNRQNMCATVFLSIQHSLCGAEIDFCGPKWGNLVTVIMAYLAENNPKRQQTWFERVKSSIWGLLYNSFNI